MNGFILLAEAGGGGPLQEIARTFGVDWAHLTAQIISFGIVCFLLHRFAYRPVLAMLEARREEIAEGLANAEKIKAELARTEAQRQEAMMEANAQATKLIEEARAAAARVQEQETQKAIAAAQSIVEKAHQATQAEHARMLAELRREVGRLVVETTAKVTGKVLTLDDQKRLAEETNRELAA
jgi:F-type H+-transporting ATPase subunit b